jgi:small subunit ribosomal protein S1
MKQLEPTSADVYITEHTVGETVTGRVVEVKNDRLKVDLGEGVFATCRLQEQAPEKPVAVPEPSAKAAASIEDLGAKLAARWKQGAPGAESQSAAKGGQIRAGQVRSFKISALEAEQKKIQLELIP